MKDASKIPVRLLATIPRGEVNLGEKRRATRLPAGPQSAEGESELRYGPYLEAVQYLLLRNNCQKILETLAHRLGRPVTLEEVDAIEIRTEKHGAFYHVARADLSVSGQIVSFAVNVAVSDRARAELERDFNFLRGLTNQYNYKFLPQVYFKGAGIYREPGKPLRWLHMFVAEWFQDYHEFHLHRDRTDGSSRMLLWDLGRGSYYLSEHQCVALYRLGAKILTLYYNSNNFKQIYPWHHAAGDFVLRKKGDTVDLRLVTVRDYASVVDFTTGKKAGKLFALILFFLHLTIQMRIDRLDGVGDVVWAEDYCLEGVVPGFLEGLTEGEGGSRKGIPSPLEIYALLRNFTGEEWLQFLVEVLGTYNFSQEELSLIRDHADAHIVEDIIGNLSVLANVFEIRTDKAERLVFRSTFQLINTGDGVLVENIAANTVIRVSWISNNSTVEENFYCPTNEPFLWIVGVYLQDHHVGSFIFSEQTVNNKRSLKEELRLCIRQ